MRPALPSPFWRGMAWVLAFDAAAPEVIGGREPPIGNIARRRGFGLHSMVL